LLSLLLSIFLCKKVRKKKEMARGTVVTGDLARTDAVGMPFERKGHVRRDLPQASSSLLAPIPPT
jgi:hypothetical protein